jgi:hypothetical protein
MKFFIKKKNFKPKYSIPLLKNKLFSMKFSIKRLLNETLHQKKIPYKKNFSKTKLSKKYSTIKENSLMKFLIKKYISYLRKISNKNLPSKNTFSLLKEFKKVSYLLKRLLKEFLYQKKLSSYLKKNIFTEIPCQKKSPL